MIEISYKTYCMFGALGNPNLTCVWDKGCGRNRYFKYDNGQPLSYQNNLPLGPEKS